MNRKIKVINWAIALLGLWEFGDIAAPFVPGFGNIPAYLWNHVIAGLILVIVGARAATTHNTGTARTMNWIAAAAGVWLIIASFILRDPTVALGLLNDVAVGVIVVILSFASLLLLPYRP